MYGCRVIHKKGCPFLMDTDKAFIHIMFYSPQMARNAGNLLFEEIEVCLFCCKEYYYQKRKEDLSEILEKEKSCLYKEITLKWESDLKSFLN